MKEQFKVLVSSSAKVIITKKIADSHIPVYTIVCIYTV